MNSMHVTLAMLATIAGLILNSAPQPSGAIATALVLAEVELVAPTQNRCR